MNINDPLLTAYALGELAGDEAARVEAFVRTNDAARAEVEAIRRTAGVLRDELLSEPIPSLSEEQRIMIEREMTAPSPHRGRAILGYLAAAALGAAAAVAVSVTLNAVTPPGPAPQNTSVALHTPRASVNPAPTNPKPARTSEPTNAEGDAERDTEVQRLLQRAVELRRQQQYHDASLVFEQAQLIDPNNVAVQTLKEMAEDTGLYVESRRRRRRRDLAIAGQRLDGIEATPPYWGVMSHDNGIAATYGIRDSKPEFARFHQGPEFDLDNALAAGERADVDLPGRHNPNFHTEAYDAVVHNPFLAAFDNPLSTFSIDVDTASYANTRRMLKAGQLPPPGAVRIEEFINYFPYNYSAAGDDLLADAHFAAHVEVAQCPWNHDHQLVRIGLKGKEVAQEQRPASNLVFLIDVSGSMTDANKLPLLREAFALLTRQLTDNDRIALVVYAGASGLVLDSTRGTPENKAVILDAIARLEAGGSTNGGAGIRLAYDVAAANFIEGGINRVILATDGDFNVGTTSRDELVRLIEDKRKTGVHLSILAVGEGNLQDATMEELSNKGNGNYYYLDSLREAQKVLVQEMSGTLITIAKDVKIQVEFNPAAVAGYRLIGYENRLLAKEDFNDDTKDAGEIGAGHTVTALYELVPAKPAADQAERDAELTRDVDALRYIKPAALSDAATANELLTLKLRYKQPDGDVSTKVELPVPTNNRGVAEASEDFRFAAAVAAFGMILRDSPYKADADLNLVANLAHGATGEDRDGYRAEFLTLVEQARSLITPPDNARE